jgi:hypothetical protein
MIAIANEPAEHWTAWVQKPAWRFLPVAAMAAVFAVFMAAKSVDLLDDELAGSYSTLEVEW